jgi:hypothetical protein
MLKLTLFIPLLALVAAAQSPLADWEKVRMLTPGTGIRVIEEASKPASGNLESVAESNLVLNAIAGRQTFERARITSVAVKREGHRVRNTFIGLGAGLAGGFALGAVIGHGCTGFLSAVPQT